MGSQIHEKPKLGTVLVTGGTGFVGHHIVNLLLQQYETTGISVIDRSISRNRRPHSDGIKYHEADITLASSVSAMIREAKPDVVIHTASATAQTDTVPPRSLCDEVNVRGTQNIVEACQAHGVKALVYTSSASVICDQSSNLYNADETWPRIRGDLQSDYYVESKSQAEDIVIAANRQGSFPLRTAVIRPGAIFGEGDYMLVPQLLDIYKQGKHYFQLGDNDNLVDFTYVKNVAHGHLLAASALLDETMAGVDGESFLITNDSPIFFWDFCRAIWVEAGCRYELCRVWKIPQAFAMPLAALSEILFAILQKPSALNCRRVNWSCSTQYYNITKAKKRLGYAPLVSMQEGIKRCVEWCMDQEKVKHGSQVHM